MLDFYFEVSFTDGCENEYIHVAAPTAMFAWDCLDKILKTLEWDNVNYGETRLLTMRNYQNSRGEFFENLFD